jgi:hypothetical protein
MRLPILLRAFAVAAAVSLASVPAFAQVYMPSVRVNVAPPAVRVEASPPAPAAGYIWIPGHWVWRDNQHVWAVGHWVQPPGGGYVWEPARWVAENGAWSFYEGHWRLTVAPAQTEVYQPPVAPAQPVVVDTAPPVPIVEVRPAAPSPTHVWIPGYWHWHGNRHFWVYGRWSAPHVGHVWEPHHWERDGVRWRFVWGRWR